MFGRTVQMVTIPPVVVSGPQASVTQIDPVAVREALKACADAAAVENQALAKHLEAVTAYHNRYNAELIGASGPEYVRKAVAESAAAGLRSVRDAAEVARARAGQQVRLAELGWRSAMAGAAAPEAGES